MHQRIYNEFEKILCKHRVSGKVLEVGAIPSKQSLLTIKVLKKCEKVGINLEDISEFSDFRIIKGNANKMEMFSPGTFDCVLCNAMLEHDQFFWKSICEMKRVLKVNGLLIIGVPIYTDYWFNRITKFVKGNNSISDFLKNTTICFKIHDAPGDYYRFSIQAIQNVFFDGFRDVRIITLMTPPRSIAYGYKK